MKLMNREKGAIAIITVIFLSIVLSVLTLGFLRLSITGQRISVDDDLSTRAFFAAEAGVEDARRMLQQAAEETVTSPLSTFKGVLKTQYNSEDCETATAKGYTSVVNADLGVEYSCLTMKPADDVIADVIDDETNLVYIPNNVNSIKISWHQPSENGEYALTTENKELLHRKSNWQSNKYPALLRVSLLYTIAPFGIEYGGQKTFFLYPKQGQGTNGGGSVAQSFNNLDRPLGDSLSGDGKVLSTDCDESATGDNYVCSYYINDLPTGLKVKAAAITPIYRNTRFKVEGQSGAVHTGVTTAPTGGVKRSLDSQVIVDSTGKATDVFRRVQARVSVAATFISLRSDELLIDPNNPLITTTNSKYSVISGKSLCKNFELTTTGKNYSGDNWCQEP